MNTQVRIYMTIYCVVAALPAPLKATEHRDKTAPIAQEKLHVPLQSFARGMAIAPYVQIPWIVGWALGHARKKSPLNTARTIFSEFVDGTTDTDLAGGISGLLFQQIALTKLLQLIGSYRHNAFLQHPLHAWVLVNCMLIIGKLFKVRYNLEKLNYMITEIKKFNIMQLLAFQKARAKGLHGYIFN